MLKPTMSAILVAALLLAGAAAPALAAPNTQEAKLIAALKSGAPLKEKVDACRLLAQTGTKDAVPTLAALLGDEKLAHMARYALETIPDPSVDTALRDALGKLKGLHLVGVIGSIGARRDTKAIPALANLLKDGDAYVAQGAARALGNIGTAEAATALQGALPGASKANKLALWEGLFRCAEALGGADAAAICDKIRATKNAPHQVRAGALRGAVLARGNAGLPLLMQAVRGSDFAMVEAAARIAMEMPGTDVVQALSDEMGKLPADTQILLCNTLARRGDAAALPALLKAAGNSNKTLSIAAIRALPAIPHESAVPVLVGLLGNADQGVAAAAQSALGAMGGPKVNAAIRAMLTHPDARTRVTAIEMLEQRRDVSAIPALLKAAGDSDGSVRVASIKVLSSLAGAGEFPALVALLAKAKATSDIRATERALSAMCTRLSQPSAGKIVILKAVYGDLPNGAQADVTEKVAALVKAGAVAVAATNGNFGDAAPGIPKKMTIEYTVDGVAGSETVKENETVTLTTGSTPPALIDALCAAVPQAPAKPKLALLRVLRSARGPKALAAVRTATRDADTEISSAATALLCSWPSAEALPDVMQLAKTATNERDKILALRGWFRLLPLANAPDAKKLASLKEALALAGRNEEKKLALAALAGIQTPEALAIAASHLGDAALKEEAALAAVAIAEKIAESHPAQTVKAMEQVAKTSGNAQTKQRAEKALGQARTAMQK